ncbi:MAG: hypothetical protein NCW75_08440 [Phycisphaera sp.]|nr:MAG: hypothetical protein NCW75_08440 [Phycisphaera sp.]
MTPDPTIHERKADILRLGQEAVAQRGARRRARRHAVVMVALAAGATVLAVTLAPTPIHPEGPIAHDDAPAPTGVAIQRVATSAGLAESLEAAPDITGISRVSGPATRVQRVSTPVPVERIGDREALALLREAGTPAGLIRVEGRVTLVYHDREPADGPSSRAPAIEPAWVLARHAVAMGDWQ